MQKLVLLQNIQKIEISNLPNAPEIEITKTKNVSDDAMILGASNPFTFVTNIFELQRFRVGVFNSTLTKNVFKKRSLCCFASPQVLLLPRRRRCSARPTCTWRTGRQPWMGARAKSGRVYFKVDHMFLTFGLMVNVTDIVEKQFLWYFEHAYLGNCTSNLFLRKIGQYLYS